jgi:hypothetical protein
MNAHQQLALQTVTVPDLEVTLEATRLLCSVFQSIQQVDWRATQPIPVGDPTPHAILQTLLTYSYAVGNFSSDEIESAAIHDPATRYLCANYTPRSETIREFRRHNAASVTASLVNLFKAITAAAPQTYCAAAFERFEGLERPNRFAPSHNLFTLAQQRLARAIKADSHALDM